MRVQGSRNDVTAFKMQDYTREVHLPENTVSFRESLLRILGSTKARIIFTGAIASDLASVLIGKRSHHEDVYLEKTFSIGF